MKIYLKGGPRDGEVHKVSDGITAFWCFFDTMQCTYISTDYVDRDMPVFEYQHPSTEFHLNHDPNERIGRVEAFYIDEDGDLILRHKPI